MQIPTQPPQAKVNQAKRHIRAHLVTNPDYRVTPHDLVGDVLEPYQDGYPLDVAIAATDEMAAAGELEEVGLHTYIYARPGVLRQPREF